MMWVFGEGWQYEYYKEQQTWFRGCSVQHWLITNDLLVRGNSYRNPKNLSEYFQFPDQE